MGGSGVDGSVDEEAFLSEAGMGSVASGDGMAGAAALRLRAEAGSSHLCLSRCLLRSSHRRRRPYPRLPRLP